jgi:hypothetical protein
MKLSTSVFVPFIDRMTQTTFQSVSRWGKLLCIVCAALGATLSLNAQRVVKIPPAESPPPKARKSPAATRSSGEDTGFIVDMGIIMRKTQERTPPPPTNLTVMYKLRYGEVLRYVMPNGETMDFEQWQSFKNDTQKLMTQVNERLKDGNNYQASVADLASQYFDPLAIPLLYMTGDYDFVLTDEEVKNLRQYILDGGTILFNAARGQDEFSNAVVREMQRVLPNKQFMQIGDDHPILNGSRRIGKVSMYRAGRIYPQEPRVYTIDIGTRAAAILVPAGMGAGWGDNGMDQLGTHMAPGDAVSLGVNIVGYALSNTEYGRFLAQPFDEYEGTTRKGDVFRFVLARYAGSWHLNPGLETTIPHALHSMAKLDVDYAPRYVDLDDVNGLKREPLIFMTGHYDFQLTEDEVKNLRDYLSRGGLLVAVSGAGFNAFNQAFAREIMRVLPDAQLFPLPPTHPLFNSSWEEINKVNYTSAAKRNNPSLDRPMFYGIFIENRLAVLFSPFDLFSEMNRESNKYARGVVYEDALKLLLNTVFYALDN